MRHLLRYASVLAVVTFTACVPAGGGSGNDDHEPPCPPELDSCEPRGLDGRAEPDMVDASDDRSDADESHGIETKPIYQAHELICDRLDRQMVREIRFYWRGVGQEGISFAPLWRIWIIDEHLGGIMQATPSAQPEGPRVDISMERDFTTYRDGPCWFHTGDRSGEGACTIEGGFELAFRFSPADCRTHEEGSFDFSSVTFMEDGARLTVRSSDEELWYADYSAVRVARATCNGEPCEVVVTYNGHQDWAASTR